MTAARFVCLPEELLMACVPREDAHFNPLHAAVGDDGAILLEVGANPSDARRDATSARLLTIDQLPLRLSLDTNAILNHNNGRQVTAPNAQPRPQDIRSRRRALINDFETAKDKIIRVQLGLSMMRFVSILKDLMRCPMFVSTEFI